MCFPALITGLATAFGTTAATVSTGFAVAGAATTAYGAYQQSAAQKDAAKYSASVANANAKTAEFRAQDALDRGQRDAENVGRRQSALRGQQKAGLAQAGLDLSSGTPGAILEATDYYGLQDQATSANNAGKEAYGHRAQGANYTAEAGAQTARASSISPFSDAGLSLLGSATKVASRWLDNNPVQGSGSPWSAIGTGPR